MMEGPEHLVIAPILIPFFAGALMLLLDEGRRRERLALGVASAMALLIVAVLLVGRAGASPLAEGDGMAFYLLGDWAAPYGIVLVLDRLTALMLLLTALLAIPALAYSGAGWQRQGRHFQSLFQFLLMGLNGAFLTGDLFNLFVFFEVLLAASYGLLLHGSGPDRVGAGLHYIAVNLLASLMFLIGVSLVYGVTGTLNMAHLAVLIPGLAPEDRTLLHMGAAILGVAFLVKAGTWPLSFWLPGTYAAASPPVAAMFAILTKVGVYAALRLSMLLFGPSAGASSGFGAEVLVAGGMVTVAFGLLGAMSSQALARMAGHLILISSGTTLAALGFALTGGGPAMLAGALYYLVGSTLATSALFLLVEPLGRGAGDVVPALATAVDPYGPDGAAGDATEVGVAIPGPVALLGLCFGACLLALAGMPPLAGFVGKFSILSSLLDSPILDRAPGAAWAFLTLLLVSGLATLLALTRVGIQAFWSAEAAVPLVRPFEVGPVVALVALVLVMSIAAEDVMQYLDSTAQALHTPPTYTIGVDLAPRMIDQPRVVP